MRLVICPFRLKEELLHESSTLEVPSVSATTRCDTPRARFQHTLSHASFFSSSHGTNVMLHRIPEKLPENCWQQLAEEMSREHGVLA